jgi:N-acetylmuramoyl-L-alanine amidase
MSRYLTELADVLRGAGLAVIEYDGWQTRARGSGGYTGDRPWCVMWHHTASSADPGDDAHYCAVGDPDAPICNALIARDGVVWLIAAGATNTNGKGYPLTFSRGTVPADQMNTHAVGLEICNAGTGEPYPAEQITAVFAVSLAIAAAYGLEPADAAEHAEYAPDRKIDPATAAAVAGSWRPASINSSGTWSPADLRAELARRAGAPLPPPVHPGTPAPPPTLEDLSMVVALDENGTAWIGDGMTRWPIPSEAVFSNYVVLGKAGAYRFVNTSGDVVNGWPDVHAVGGDTLEALGRPAP